jgi:polysaccharide export outer membrane protein
MNKYLIKWIFIGTAIFCSLQAITAELPSNITDQQIQQFKNLSPSQQKSLAQSMGVDLSEINLTGANTSKAATPQLSLESLVAPRKENTSDNKKQHAAALVEIDQAIVSQFDNKKSTVTLKPFGYSLFAGEPSTFAPITDIQVSLGYKLGPGDSISIQLYGKESTNLNLTINRQGNINLPKLGPINIAGQTFSEAKQLIEQIINDRKIGVKSSISMGDLRSIRVFVLGEAYRPASYTLSSLSTVTQALYAAGGVNNIGSLRNIQIKRNGKVVSTFDLYDLLLQGNTADDVNLMTGDVVFVPTVGKTVGIKGEVVRPAIYEIKHEDTLPKLIQLAGGLLPTAYASIGKIERINKTGLRSIVNVDINETNQAVINNGDILEVGSVLTTLEQSVTIKGHVSRAGIYGWRKGMQLSDLVTTINDFKAQPDLGYILVVRKNPITGLLTSYNVNFTDYIKNKNSLANFVLQAEDTIYVFNKNDNRSSSLDPLLKKLTTQTQLAQFPDIVSIQGAVHNPGRYPLTQQATVSALLNAGMGYNQAAELNFALLARKDNRLDTSVLYIDLSKKQDQQIALQPLDRLFVFNKNMPRQGLLEVLNKELIKQATKNNPQAIVNITGDVQFPGQYPFVVSMTTNKLIMLAGGLNESSYMVDAELTRFKHDGVKQAAISHQNVNLQGKAFPLKPLDSLQIKRIPDWRDKRTVELRGEFVFPGSYVLQKGETLFDVIERAGGLTNEADTNAAIFTREALREKEKVEIDRLAEMLKTETLQINLSPDGDNNDLSVSESKQLAEQLKNTKAIGRLVINLPEILEQTQNSTVRLANGDALYVPKARDSVTVLGEVQYTTSHLFQKNYDVYDYINHSGGLKTRADSDRIYIIKANGAVLLANKNNWFSANENELSAGDAIVVPLDLQYRDSLGLWTAVTQIVYNSAIAVAAISSL